MTIGDQHRTSGLGSAGSTVTGTASLLPSSRRNFVFVAFEATVVKMRNIGSFTKPASVIVSHRVPNMLGRLSKLRAARGYMLPRQREADQ